MKQIKELTATAYPNTLKSFNSVLGVSLNVKHYGANGDGITDDTSAIQAALTYLSNIGGGKLFIPNGNYQIKNTIYVSSNITIEGESHEAIFELMDNWSLAAVDAYTDFTYYPYFCISSAENVVLSNLKIQGNQNQTVIESIRHAGILILNSEKIVLDNLFIEEINYLEPTSIEVFSIGYTCVHISNTDGCLVRGGKYHKAGYESIGISNFSKNVVFDGVYLGPSRQHSIQLHKNTTDVKITNCYIENESYGGTGRPGSCIAVHASANEEMFCDNLIISNNYIDFSTEGPDERFAIHMHDSDGGGMLNCKIIGNTIKSGSKGIWIAGNSEQDSSAIISNNIIETVGQAMLIETSFSQINTNKIKSAGIGIQCESSDLKEISIINGNIIETSEESIITSYPNNFISANHILNNVDKGDYAIICNLGNLECNNNVINQTSLNFSAIHINADTEERKIILSGNQIKSITAGIYFSSAANTSLIATGNDFETGAYCIRTQGILDRMQIVGNRFKNSSSVAVQIHPDWGAKGGINISNNLFDLSGGGTYGIIVHAGRAVINGNEFQGTGTAIEVKNTAQKCIITSNLHPTSSLTIEETDPGHVIANNLAS